MKNFLAFFMVSFVLSGCATKERQEVLAICSFDANKNYPPKIERILVNKTREIKVPTGNSTCTNFGSFSQCTMGTTTESIPYTVMQNVDINKDLRNESQKACADQICFQRYKNNKCKIK